MQKHQIQRIEKQVFIGSTHLYKVRMIIELLPRQQVNERLRRINDAGIRKGYTPSKHAKAKASINVYITNTSPKKVSADKIRLYYSLRWQIELMFKTWKSILHIHQLKPMNVQRYLCHLYAKLIWVCISFTIFSFLCGCSIENGTGQMSLFKIITHLKTHLKAIVLCNRIRRKEQIKKLMAFAFKYWKLEQRKSKIGLEETLTLL